MNVKANQSFLTEVIMKSVNDGMSRRDAIVAGAAALAGTAVLWPGIAPALAQQAAGQPTSDPDKSKSDADHSPADQPQAPGVPGHDYTPVTVPNCGKIPWKIVDGVKVFHMVAEEVWNEFAPGMKALCWGYNGQVHPLLEAVEGDRVRSLRHQSP